MYLYDGYIIIVSQTHTYGTNVTNVIKSRTKNTVTWQINCFTIPQNGTVMHVV